MTRVLDYSGGVLVDGIRSEQWGFRSPFRVVEEGMSVGVCLLVLIKIVSIQRVSSSTNDSDW